MMAAGYGTVDVLRYILDTLGDMELEKEPASIILSKCPESEFDLILIQFFSFLSHLSNSHRWREYIGLLSQREEY